MRRRGRIVVELFAPPLLGTGYYVLLTLLLRGSVLSWAGVLGVLFLAGMACALPSVAYCGLMENAFDRGLRQNSRRQVIHSTLYGTMAGLALGLLDLDVTASMMSVGEDMGWPFRGLVLFLIGPLTGLTVGLILRRLPEPPRPAAAPTKTAVAP